MARTTGAREIESFPDHDGHAGFRLAFETLKLANGFYDRAKQICKDHGIPEGPVCQAFAIAMYSVARDTYAATAANPKAGVRLPGIPSQMVLEDVE